MEQREFCQGAKNICYNDPIPAGWVKTNDFWNPTTCGNPRSQSYNVFEIKEISGLPKGSIPDVCYDARIPAGWVVTGKKWNPTACGHPPSNSNNVYTIARQQ
jgi:hypothetical protein